MLDMSVYALKGGNCAYAINTKISMGGLSEGLDGV